MKNMFKKAAAVAVALLLTASAFAGCRKGSCEKSCNVSCKTECAPCKLPAPKCTKVQYTTTCQGTPKYHWVCQKVYEPCNDKQTQSCVVVREQCTGVRVEGEQVEGDDYAPAKTKSVKARARR